MQEDSAVTLHLVRHGQAGLRSDYDRLSPLGQRQARLLGRAFVERGVDFDACWSGALERQQSTARLVAASYAEAGRSFPPIVTEPLWNEFDLDEVYARIAPHLAEQDAAFRAHYEELKRTIDDAGHSVHREWTAADIAVADAWVRGTVPFEGESFAAFLNRIREALRRTAASGASKIAVFTSATPLAICAAEGAGAPDGMILRLGAAVMNTAFTRIQEKDGRFWLLSFNETPHLISKDLQTYR